MHLRTGIAAAVLLTATLAGCGSNSGTQASSGHTSASAGAAQGPEVFSKTLGCTKTEEKPTEQLYVQKLYLCTTPKASLEVYTFADSSSRDNWWKIGKQMGGVSLGQGDTWIAVKAT